MKQFSLEEYLKNPKRKIVTRSGKDVRIICTDFNNEIYPIVGEIPNMITPVIFTKEGRVYKWATGTGDLFFAPEKHEGWANMFKSSKGNNVITSDIFESKEEAEEAGKNYNNYIVTAKVEWEE